jgi:hypothetical protein
MDCDEGCTCLQFVFHHLMRDIRSTFRPSAEGLAAIKFAAYILIHRRLINDYQMATSTDASAAPVDVRVHHDNDLSGS